MAPTEGDEKDIQMETKGTKKISKWKPRESRGGCAHVTQNRDQVEVNERIHLEDSSSCTSRICILYSIYDMSPLK